MSFGPLEIIILVAIVLLIFGARKLPELGSGLGQGIRGFGKGITGDDEKNSDEPRQVDAAAGPAPPTPPAEHTHSQSGR